MMHPLALLVHRACVGFLVAACWGAACAAPVGPTPPDMPLLRLVNRAVETKAFPPLAGTVKPLLPRAIPPLDDPYSILTDFLATTHGDTSAYFLTYSTMGAATGFIDQLCYTEGDRIWVQQRNPRTDRLPLLFSDQVGLGVLIDAGWLWKGEGKPGARLAIGAHDDVLTLTPITEPGRGGADIVTLTWDADRHKTLLASPAAGTVLATVPATDADTVLSAERSASRVGPDLVVGSLDELTEDAEDLFRLTWHRLANGRGDWITTHRPIDAAYRMRLMPMALAPMLQASRNGMAKVLPDGSLVFRIYYVRQQGAERVEYSAIVRQPLGEAQPTPLVWALSYWYYDEGDRATSNTMSRIWYPLPDGEIGTIYSKLDFSQTLIFDVDPIDGSVIYLVEGRPWRLSLPK